MPSLRVVLIKIKRKHQRCQQQASLNKIANDTETDSTTSVPIVMSIEQNTYSDMNLQN